VLNHDIDQQLASLLQYSRSWGMNLSTAALVLAAERRGISCTQLSRCNPNLLQLGSGSDAKYINGTLIGDFLSQTSDLLAQHMKLYAVRIALAIRLLSSR
jgi:hypothetical protein